MGYKVKSTSVGAPASYVPHGPLIAVPELSAINALADVQVPQVSGGYTSAAYSISGNQVQVAIYTSAISGAAPIEVVSGTNLSGLTISVRAKGY